MTNLVSIGFTAETTGLKKAQTELNNLSTAGGKADKQLDTLSRTVGVLGAALAALGTATLAQDVIKYSDAWKNVTSQIRQVTDSEKELVAVRKEVVALANQTRTGLAETASLYAAIDRSTTSLGYSTQQQIELTRTLNNLFVAGGRPAAESAGAIRQLSQALESGALRGDEFNSVAEGAPRILDALQMKLKMTRGELREFAATGGITAKILSEALSDYSGEAQRLADQTEKTFAQSMTLASNNVTQFIGGLDTLNDIINDVGSGIEYASRNIDAIADAASAAATVIGGAYAIGLAKSAAAAAEKVIATNAAAKADLLALQAAERTAFAEKQAAIENLNRARSAVARAEAEVASSRAIQAAQIAEMRVRQSALSTEIAVEKQRLAAQISDIGRMQSSTRMAELRLAEVAATRALSTAEAQLAATTASSSAALAAANQARSVAAGQAAVASEALAAATVRVTAAQAAASVTANALGAAWRFMLGPWGLVITALGAGAAAFALTADSADLTTDAISKQIKPVDLLTESYDKMTAAQVRNSQNAIRDRLSAIDSEIKKLESLRDIQSAAAGSNAEFAAFIGISSEKLKESSKAADSSQAAIDALRQEQTKLNAKLAEGSAALTTNTTATTKHSKELQKIIDAIADERKELELGADAFSDYALRREVITAGGSAALAEQLVKEAQALRLLRSEMEAEKVISEATAEADNDRAEELQRLQDRLDPLTALTREYNRELAILQQSGTAEQIAALGKEYEEARKQLEQLPEATDEWLQITERAIDRIDEQFSNAWLNIGKGFGSFKDALVDGFKQMLAEMAHAAITKPILIKFQQSLTGGSGGFSGSGGYLLGSVGKLFGLNSGASGGGILGSIGSVLGPAMAVFSIGSAISELLGGKGGIGGLLGGLTGGLFGGKTKATGTRLELELLGGDITGRTATDYEKRKSLFRGSKRWTESTVFDTTEIDAAFDAISLSLSDAAKRLGITGADEILKGFSASFNLNIKDMTEQQIQEAIQQWVGTTTEGMIAAVFGDAASGLGKAGESALDTLVRVTQNFEVVKAVTKELGLQFDLTGKAGLEAATSIAELAGGIDALAQLSGVYYQEFYTDAERQAMLAKQLGEAFAGLNMAMPDSKDAFRALVDGIDLTTEAGQKLFAELMKLSPSFAQLMKLSPSFAQLMNAINAEEAAKAAKAEQDRKNAINDAMSALERAVDAEKALADARLQSAQAAYKAEIGRIDTLRDAVESQYSQLTSNKQSAESAINKAFDAERSAIQKAADARIAALNSERGLISRNMADMLQLAGSLRQAAGLGGNTDVAGALAAARRGDFTAAQSLNVQAVTDAGFGSAADMLFAQAVQRNQVGEIASLADKQASALEQQLSAIDRQVLAVEEQTEKQLTALDKQLNALLGIDDTVLPLAEAIKKYQDAQLAIDEFGYEAQLAQLDSLVELADKQLAEAIAQHAIDTARLDSILSTAQAQVDALNGVNTSVLSVVDAVNRLAVVVQTPQPPAQQTAAAAGSSAEETNAILKQLLAASMATAKHTKTSADVLELNQFESQEAAP